MPRPFELDDRAFQKLGNYQCWWLSLLEVARDAKKLDPIFAKGGKLYNYYVAGGKATPWVPDEGQVPTNLSDKDPKFTSLKTDKKFNWESFKKVLVYGPQWQRMIMYYLWDKDNKCPWHLPDDTVNSSARAEELATLLRYLGLTGITFGTPRTLIESTVRDVVKSLKPGQRLIVDKTGHAMSGEVMLVEETKRKTYNKIEVFNQAKKEQTMPDDIFPCWVRESTKDGKTKLLSKTGNTVITWFLPVVVT